MINNRNVKPNSTPGEKPGIGALRLRLRSETAAHHQNLEDGLRLLAPDLTAKRYREILEGFFSVHTALEDRLEQIFRTRPDSSACALYLPDRRKLEWLRSDLQLAPGDLPVAHHPFDFGWIKDEPELWGALYVIEGSTLGGQVLTRELKSFDLGNLGTRYFESYGPDVGRLWQRFSHELNTLPEAWHDAIVKAADRTFAELARHFKEVAP